MTQRTNEQLWKRFKKYYLEFPATGLAIDLSRMNFPGGFFEKMAEPMRKAHAFMRDVVEGGGIANPDENRMVGHYWLRDTATVPAAHPEIVQDIQAALADIKAFAADVHAGRVQGARGPFKNLLVIGIGGSALGPQFVANALGNPATDKLKPYFFDNTDPDGMFKVLAALAPELGQTLAVVISKSGETKETRNGMLEAKAAYERAGLSFAQHAVAVTGPGKKMDQLAQKEGWIRRFPMWDWVGGRTSETSAVGLLPAALQGLDIDTFLAGARACDIQTRNEDVLQNPSALLALMWYYAGKGKGAKDMVIIPYKDRLDLFSKYLQQLIMESLGKELDLEGKVVSQGIAVYGNKGSTDQHAYVQQLREGVLNFFVTFIEVLKDADAPQLVVEQAEGKPGVVSGDFLFGFLQGTRQALYEKGRESITITVKDMSPFTVGVLIALYERAVGYYAQLVNINAYHQPGVQAGKLAADAVIALQLRVVEALKAAGKPQSLKQIAETVNEPGRIEMIFKICEHLASNPGRGVARSGSKTGIDSRYTAA